MAVILLDASPSVEAQPVAVVIDRLSFWQLPARCQFAERFPTLPEFQLPATRQGPDSEICYFEPAPKPPQPPASKPPPSRASALGLHAAPKPLGFGARAPGSGGRR